MSTSYGFACPEHNAETNLYAAAGPSGRATLAVMWAHRDVVAGLPSLEDAIVTGPEWFGVTGGEARELEAFVVEHAGCPVEVVSEYGDRELADDVVADNTVPDADDVVRQVLTLLHFPADAIGRTAPAIVDALDAQRILSWRRRPERLRT